MFLALVFSIFFNFFGLPGVDGATCITKSTCAWTDFTLPLCISGTCKCLNSSFVPIRSGCGLQMRHRPVVSAQQGRTNQVISGQGFELSCFLDKYNSYYTFEWKLGEAILITASNTYTALADDNTVGSFTCRVRTSEENLSSLFSYDFEVVMLGGPSGQATSNERPTIYVPTNSAVEGSTVNLECNNIPMGYMDTIIYTINGVNTTEPSVVITSDNAGKRVTCTLTSPSAGVIYSRPTSAVGYLPILTTRISSVTVVVGSGSPQRLVCALTPSAIYLQSSTITYTWKFNGREIPSDGNATYFVEQYGFYDISCTARLSGQEAVSSRNRYTVIAYNTVPTASTTKPLKGGRVILTCGVLFLLKTVKYIWLKNLALIEQQFDRKLQLDNVSTTDSAIYSCGIDASDLGVFIQHVLVEVQTTIPKPIIQTIGESGCNSSVGEYGNYWLVCYTVSDTDGMTYEWTVNGSISSVSKKFFKLTSVTSRDNGEYACTAKYKDLVSEASDSLKLTVMKPGRHCDHGSNCVLPWKGYTGKCDVNEKCECSYGYSQKGDVCSGVMSNMGSIVVVVLALIQRLF